METKIIKNDINISKLKNMASKQFGDIVKAVVDLDKKIMAVGGELHADQEAILLENGSKQEHLWGINLWVNRKKSDWIDFDSLINIRPSQNNCSRTIKDFVTREKITQIVNNLVVR